jgi:hypothetical protein
VENDIAELDQMQNAHKAVVNEWVHAITGRLLQASIIQLLT